MAEVNNKILHDPVGQRRVGNTLREQINRKKALMKRDEKAREYNKVQQKGAANKVSDWQMNSPIWQYKETDNGGQDGNEQYGGQSLYDANRVVGGQDQDRQEQSGQAEAAIGSQGSERAGTVQTQLQSPEEEDKAAQELNAQRKDAESEVHEEQAGQKLAGAKGKLKKIGTVWRWLMAMSSLLATPGCLMIFLPLLVVVIILASFWNASLLDKISMGLSGIYALFKSLFGAFFSNLFSNGTSI